MRTVYAFLDVDPTLGGNDFAARLNTRQDKREYSRAARRVRDQPLLKLAYRLPPRQRERLLEPIRRLVSSPVQDAEFPADLRDRIARALADDVARFRDMVGLPFESWSV